MAAVAQGLPAAIGPYDIQGLLGEGGMGVVYRAVHRDSGVTVALKTVLRVQQNMLEAVRREIRALSEVRHEGVVAIRDAGIEHGSPWFAMDLLDRRTVQDYCDELWGRADRTDKTTVIEPARAPSVAAQPAPELGLQGPVARLPIAANGELPAVLTLVRRIAAALAYVHGEGFVHGDLKAGNVFVRSDGAPVLVDFGLTTWFGGGRRERLEWAKTRGGTVALMAPEVIGGGVIDARADLYSLGCLFYLLVTGDYPFIAGDNEALFGMHLNAVPHPPSALVDGVPAEVDKLILRLLAKAPQERIGHAQDVADALATLTASPAVEPGRATRYHLYRPRLAGRDDVRELLAGRIGDLRHGSGGLVFIGGESGVGKTFLCNDLGARAAALGIRVVTGECDPLTSAAAPGGADEHAVPLHPFRELFRALCDRLAPSNVAPPSAAIRQLLAQHGPALARYDRELARFVTAGASDAQGDEARTAGIRATADALVAMAADAPLLVILDDVQWADALSLDVLRFLASQPFEACALLLVATYRSDEVNPELATLVERRSGQRVLLKRLGPEAVASQVKDMLAVATAPAALVRYLDENSEGVPFFVAEYLRAAMEKQILRREAGQWVVSATGESLDALTTALDLPASLHELVAARLDRLSPRARALASVAAVIGRELDASLLAETARDRSDDFFGAVAELVRREVLQQPDPGRYRFVHDKLREIAYQRIDADERVALHARAAEQIERQPENQASYPALARHFRLAGDRGKALRYARLAGEQAWAMGSFHDAREHLSRALDLSPPRTIADTPVPERLTEAQTRHWLGASLFCEGDLDLAIDNFRDALRWLGYAALPRGRRGLLRFTLRQFLQQIAHRWLPKRLHVIAPGLRRDLAAEGAQIAVRLSWCFAFRYRLREMMASVLLGANLSDRSGALGPCAAAHAALGAMVGYLGIFRTARRYFERAQQSAAESADPIVAVKEAQSECVYYLNQGNWDALRSIGNPALDKGSSIGATHDTEALAQTLITSSILTGDLTEGERQARSLADMATRLGHNLQSCWGVLTVATALFRRGEFRETIDLLVRIEATCRDRDVVSHLECLVLQAGASLRLGDQAAALALAERARQVAAEHGSGSMFGYCYNWLLPEIYAAAARRHAPGTAEQRELMRHFHVCRRTAWRFARMCRVARPFAWLQLGRSFETAGRPRRAHAAFERSRREAVELGMPFDEATAEMELAQLESLTPSEREAHATRAHELFDRLQCSKYASLSRRAAA